MIKYLVEHECSHCSRILGYSESGACQRESRPVVFEAVLTSSYLGRDYRRWLCPTCWSDILQPVGSTHEEMIEFEKYLRTLRKGGTMSYNATYEKPDGAELTHPNKYVRDYVMRMID